MTKKQIRLLGVVFCIAYLFATLVLFGLSFAGEREELQLKQAFLQEKMARMEAQFRVLQLEYPQTQQELQKIINQLKELQEKEKDKKAK